MSQHKLIGVRQFKSDTEQHEDPEVRRLITSAARATEVFDEDELERHAEEQRKLEEKQIVCGVSLPGNVHAILKALSKQEKKAIKEVALEHIIGAIKARHILINALKYSQYDGHNMPKDQVRAALVVLGLKRENQP